MGILDGKVGIVTGAGRGLGRAEALQLASEGASVVVNDLGVTVAGESHEEGPAREVAEEILAAGGKAVADFSDCSDWAGAEGLIQTAIDMFGRLDILVNNAGILRDRMSFNMTEEEWDAVIRVHLKGHFATSHFAAAHWRAKRKQGEEVSGRIINTSSEAGLFGNPGQVNYAAAKAGIAAMTIVLARELAGVGVTVNAISPRASTRMVGGTSEPDPTGFDSMAPENVAPLVAYLASDASVEITGQLFLIHGGNLQLMQGWRAATKLEKNSAWTLDDIPGAIEELFKNQNKGPEEIDWRAG